MASRSSWWIESSHPASFAPVAERSGQVQRSFPSDTGFARSAVRLMTETPTPRSIFSTKVCAYWRSHHIHGRARSRPNLYAWGDCVRPIIWLVGNGRRTKKPHTFTVCGSSQNSKRKPRPFRGGFSYSYSIRADVVPPIGGCLLTDAYFLRGSGHTLKKNLKNSSKFV